MVCINACQSDDRLVTRFLRPTERIPTARGSLRAEQWLESEGARLRGSGIATEIVQAPSGRIALRKQDSTLATD